MFGLGAVATVFVLIAVLLPVIAVIDLIRQSFSVEKKIFWVIIIWIIPYLGSLFYFIAGRTKKA